MKEERRGRIHGLFVHSPLCGTCKVAKRMIHVMQETFPSLSIEEVNVNEQAQLAQSFKIKSVPCFVILEDGRELDRIYAFRSLAHLYTRLKPFTVVETLHKSFVIGTKKEAE